MTMKLLSLLLLVSSTVLAQGRIVRANGVNAQTGTTYTYVTGDFAKLVTHSNGSAIAATLPQANSTTFHNGWTFDVQNLGAGTLTITPTTSTINGAATLVLTTGQGAHIVSNGTNYSAQLGKGGGGGGSGDLVSTNNLSDVANTATARTNLGLAIGTNVLAPNGSAASLTGLPAAAVVAGTFGSGNYVMTGTLTASNVKRGTGSPESAVTGVVGDLYQRTDGGTSTSVYRKESGSGNTGWVAIGAGTGDVSTTANATFGAHTYDFAAATITPPSSFAGSGLTVSGNSLVVDSALYLSRANAQAGTTLSLIPASASGTAYAASMSPTLTAYTRNASYLFTPDVACGVSPTINIDGLGPIALKKISSGALVALTTNDCIAKVPYQIRAAASSGTTVDSFVLTP